MPKENAKADSVQQDSEFCEKYHLYRLLDDSLSILDWYVCIHCGYERAARKPVKKVLFTDKDLDEIEYGK